MHRAQFLTFYTLGIAASNHDPLKKFWRGMSRHRMDVLHEGLLREDQLGLRFALPLPARIMIVVGTFIVLWIIKTLIDHPIIFSIIFHRQAADR